jgi:hypothetical protein
VAVNQQVTVVNAASVGLGTNLTIDGLLTVGSSGSSTTILNGQTVTLTVGAGGEIATPADETGGVYLRTNIDNGLEGTVDIAAADTISDGSGGPSLITNESTFTIAAGGGYSLSGGSNFTNTSGTLADGGSGLSLESGTFTERGGKVTGNPVSLVSATLDDDTTAAASSFDLSSSSVLTGTGTSPGVAVNQQVTVLNAADASLGTNLTIDGLLTVGSSGSSTTILNGQTVTLTVGAGGELATPADETGGVYLRINVDNKGTVDIGAADTISDGSGAPSVITNDGLFNLETGGYSLSGGSAYTQNADGTLETTIDASTPANGEMTLSGGSPQSIAGALEVNTIGSPAPSSSWTVIGGGSTRAGTFSAYDFGANSYSVQYPADGVVLSAGPAPGLVVGPISATEGASFSGTVAAYTDPNFDGPGANDSDSLSQYTVTINWGDGSPASSGSLVQTGADTFNVTGTHTYATFGPFTLTVTVSSTDGTTVSAQGSATVVDAPITVTGAADSSVITDQSFTQQVATFTQAGSDNGAGAYTATISWGDGKPTSSGTVTADPSVPGQFDVAGTHTYSVDGVYTVSISVTDGTVTGTGTTKITSSTPSDAFTLTEAKTEELVGASHTVTVTVTNTDGGAPVAGATVAFAVTGANAGASGTCSPVTCVTGANGQVTFSYTGTTSGSDTVTATVTSPQDVSLGSKEVNVTWVLFECQVTTSGNTATETVQAADGLDTNPVFHDSANVSETVDSYANGSVAPESAHLTDNGPGRGSFLIKWTDTAGHTTYCTSGPVSFGGGSPS